MSIKEMKTLAIANEEYEVYDEKARPVENVAHMRAMTNLVAGNVIKTKGYYSENDGGGAIYYITDVQTNSKYQIPLSNELYATLIIKQETSVKQLGAFGNGESHVISSIFSTLEDAQKIYPKADSLENEIDGLAIQTAIDYMPNKIVIPEGTYMVNKTRLIERIADIVKDKIVEGITDLRDESNGRNGIRIVIELKKDVDVDNFINMLS